MRLRLTAVLFCVCLTTTSTPAWSEDTAAIVEPATAPSEAQPTGPKPPLGKKEPARKAPPNAENALPHPHKAGQTVSLPAHRKGDSGKVAGTSGLHGNSKIEEAAANDGPEEHEIAPIAPAPFAPAAAGTSPAALERPVVPVGKPAAPLDTEVPLAEPPAVTAKRLAATAAKLAATAARLAATAAKTSPTNPGQPAHCEPPPATPVATEGAPPAEAPTATAQTQPPGTGPAAPARPEVITLDQAVLDQIRLEIKSRLPYFQACADASRRRGSAEVRRVQATWTIAADGAIKEMKVDGVPDQLLATCITRMGSRPFEVKPGTELVIPAPIVFVR